MKWLTVSKRAQPAQLHWDGKKLSEVRFTILSFTVWYLVLFVCLLCASVKSKQMCPPCVDGNAFSGSSPDSTADGASLGHPGAQAGAVWGGARGGDVWGRRGGELLGLWEWTRKRQSLLQLSGGGLFHFLPKDASAALFGHFIEEDVLQEKLCALKSQTNFSKMCLLRQLTKTRWSTVTPFSTASLKKKQSLKSF